MIPYLSRTKIARSENPSFLFTPYFLATAPRGLKSLRSGKEIPPRLSAHAFRQGTWSTLMPRTWALSFPNLAMSASYEGSWFVQTGVQARGKNAMTTGPLPRHLPSATFLSRWLGRVKLGAFFPTFNFMLNLLEIFGMDDR